MKLQKTVDAAGIGLQKLEESIHSGPVILPGFERSFQLKDYLCGAQSLYAILRYFGKKVTVEQVARRARTDEDGTAPYNIRRTIESYGLAHRTLRQPGLRRLKRSIDEGNPVLISIFDDEHYSVVYGYSPTHIFVMNPSLRPKALGGFGSLNCAIERAEFRKMWDRWGMEVSER
jgi:predicted double-glycine peptidase